MQNGSPIGALQISLPIRSRKKWSPRIADRSTSGGQNAVRAATAVDLRGPQAIPQMVETEEPDLKHMGLQVGKLMGEGYSPPYQDDLSEVLTGHHCMPEPWRDLFLWSLLQNRQEMALLFLEEGREDMMGGCLVAAKILTELAKGKDRAKETEERMLINAREFADMAVSLQNAGYSSNATRGKMDLVRQLEGFGDTNALELAVSVDHKLFLSQPCAQVMLTSRWMGELADEEPRWKLCLAWFLVPFIPFLLNFKISVDCPEPDMSSQKQVPEEEAQHVDDVDRQQSNRCQQYWRKIYCFYQAPAIIFANNMVWFCLFLLLYSYVILCDFHPVADISNWEIGVGVFVLAMFCEEIRQITCQKPKRWLDKLRLYFRSYWNVLDMCCVAVFAIGVILRVIPRDGTLVAARHVLAINLIMFAIRLLHFFSAFRSLGPKLVMIARMMQDLFVFILILIVFIGGFGVAQHAILFPNSRLEWALIWDLLRRAYWQMFGELFLEDIHQYERDGACTKVPALYQNRTMQRCPDEDAGIWIDPFLLGIYLLFTQVLMLNLLIAIFSDTYSKVQVETDEHWNFQRYELIHEYSSRPSLVPPFILLSHLYYVIKAMGKSCCRKCTCGDRCSKVCRRTRRTTADGFKVQLQGQEREDFLSWSAVRGQEFVHKRRQMAMTATEERVKTMQNQILDVTTRMETMETRLAKTNELQEKMMDILKTALQHK